MIELSKNQKKGEKFIVCITGSFKSFVYNKITVCIIYDEKLGHIKIHNV